MPSPREQLAHLLKQAREQAGFETHGALARAAKIDRSVVSKGESPTGSIPSDPSLVAIAGVTGTPLDTLRDLADQARSGTPEWFMPYKHEEANASMLRCWAPIVIPGIAQTADYMRALFVSDGHVPKKVIELVAARLARQSVIGRIPVTMVIDQLVLSRLVESPTVMAEQCSQLVKVAESSAVALYVVKEGVNVGSWGALDLATGEKGTTVCMTALEDVTSTAPAMVLNALRAFDQILGAALPRAESLELVRAAEERWKAKI